MGIQRGAFENVGLNNNAIQKDKIAARYRSIDVGAPIRWLAKAKREQAKYAGSDYLFWAKVPSGITNTASAAIEVYSACRKASQATKAEATTAAQDLQNYKDEVNTRQRDFDPRVYTQLKDAADTATVRNGSTFNTLFRALTGVNSIGDVKSNTEQGSVSAFLGTSEKAGWGSSLAVNAFNAKITSMSPVYDDKSREDIETHSRQEREALQDQVADSLNPNM